MIALLVILVIFSIIFAGVSTLVDVVKRVINPHLYIKDSSRELKRKRKLLMEFLREEGFFEEREYPIHVRNRIISSLIAEASKIEGFFWDIREMGISVKENDDGGNFSHVLLYKKNTVGFNWIGPNH